MKFIKVLLLSQFLSVGVVYGNNIDDFLNVVRKKTAPSKKELVGPVKSVEELSLLKNDTVSSTYREFNEKGNLVLDESYNKGVLTQKDVYSYRGDTTQKETFYYTETFAGCYRNVSLSTKKHGQISYVCYDKNDSILDYSRLEFDVYGNITSYKSVQKNTVYKNKYDIMDRLVETRVCSDNDSMISVRNCWYGDGYIMKRDSNAFKVTYSKSETDTGTPLLVELRTYSKYDEYNSLNMECFYKWNAENRLVSFSGSVNGQFCKGRCFYDKQNRMVKVEAVDSVGNKSTVRYKYDKSNRLVEESYVSNNPRYKYSKVRKFDKKDRLVFEKTYDDGKWKVESFVYDDEKQTVVNKVGDKKNMVVAYKCSFDKYGNWTKRWDDSNFVRYRNIVYRK